MQKVAIIGCGAYMDSGYGCPGEWRCLKAAAGGEGQFEAPSAVTAFIKCECPGRTVVPNVGMAAKLSQIKPDVIYLSSCLANAKPDCPYTSPEQMMALLEAKTGTKVVAGIHDYQ